MTYIGIKMMSCLNMPDQTVYRYPHKMFKKQAADLEFLRDNMFETRGSHERIAMDSDVSSIDRTEAEILKLITCAGSHQI